MIIRMVKLGFGIIISLFGLNALFGQSDTVPYTGYLSAYDQTPTDATIDYRINSGEIDNNLDKYDGVIAVLDCNHVGKDALLVVNDNHFLVKIFDCAGIEDGGASWMIDNNIVGEIGFYLRDTHPEIVHQYATLIILEG